MIFLDSYGNKQEDRLVFKVLDVRESVSISQTLDLKLREENFSCAKRS